MAGPRLPTGTAWDSRQATRRSANGPDPGSTSSSRRWAATSTSSSIRLGRTP